MASCVLRAVELYCEPDTAMPSATSTARYACWERATLLIYYVNFPLGQVRKVESEEKVREPRKA